MKILKLLRNGGIFLNESNTLSLLKRTDFESIRNYADGGEGESKCDKPVPGKHKLVLCRENDTVNLCIQEPLHVGPEAKMPAPCLPSSFRVVIVGAGIAGLSAGARLAASGLQDFLILEAKDRPGGRIETRKLGGTIIELGAEFIDGAGITNPVYQLACINGLINDQSPKIPQMGGIFLFSDHRAVDADPRVFAAFKKTLDDLAVEATKEDEAEKTVFDHIERKMMAEINGYKDWERDDAMRQVYSLINELRAELGVDTSTITVKGYGSRILTPGPRIRVDNGSIGIVKALLKQIPKEKVVCSKGVQTIWWCEGTDGVKIRCWDGTEYFACHVIVTVSLGVLRTQNCLFCPPLPPAKLQAIRDIPFGRAGKLFLKYNEPFWLEPRLTMRFGWVKEELQDRQDWIKGIGLIEELPSSTDHILRITVGGREAQCMEACDQAGIDLFYWLNDTIGTPLPVPTEVASSKWNNDLLTGGNASFTAPCLQKTLAEPLPCYDKPTLLFAGEATEAGYVGSMQAASKSGLRAADHVLDVIKDFSLENARLEKEYQKQLIEYDKEEEPACKENP